MNGQAIGMRRVRGQGRGMSCRGTGMGGRMGRMQGMAAEQAMVAGRRQGFGCGRNFVAEESPEPVMGRGQGQRCGGARGQR